MIPSKQFEVKENHSNIDPVLDLPFTKFGTKASKLNKKKLPRGLDYYISDKTFIVKREKLTQNLKKLKLVYPRQCIVLTLL